jgi:transcription initiation factor TFIIB
MQNSIVCSICKAANCIITDLDAGEMICSGCGLVLSNNIQNTKHEWRDFMDNEISKNRRRTGPPTSLGHHDRGLYTMIGKGRKDASGNVLDSSALSLMKRLRTWDLRSQTSVNGNLRLAFDQLEILKDKLGLPSSIIEKTAYIYRKARSRGLVRGRETRIVIAAALYLACRQQGIPRTLKEICLISNVKRRAVSREYRDIIFELDLNIPIVDPLKCITRIANQINLSGKIKHDAVAFMKAATENTFSAGKNPMGLAATILYQSCLINGYDTIGQAVFAQTAGVTEVTIRNISKYLKTLLDPNWCKDAYRQQ